MGRSQKENERRLPLHPRAPRPRCRPTCGERIYLETGYGERFGVADDELRELVAGVRTREQLVAECDVILLPKPLHGDVAELRDGPGAVGLAALRAGRGAHPAGHRPAAHPDRVRGDEPLEAATGRSTCTCSTRTTSWPATARCCTPCSSPASTGDYGRRLRAVVIGFGATARGAVTALNALGVHDVDVLTHRQVAAVASPIHSARIVHFDPRRHRRRG